jgi:hypothetical protein
MLYPRENTPRAIDLDLVAQRIGKLAEIATLEHLESLLCSQADGLLNLRADMDAGLSQRAEPKG